MQNPYSYKSSLTRKDSAISNGENCSPNLPCINNHKKLKQTPVSGAFEAPDTSINAVPKSLLNFDKYRYTFFVTFLMIVLTAVTGFTVELNVARQGEIRNVPVESPYNGCLLVREGPNMESPVKGHVNNGETVQIEAAAGSWYKISAPLSGYVWASYVKVTDSQTVDTSNMTKALDLEIIVENASPWTRDDNLPGRQKLAEENDTATPPELPTAP